MARRNPPSFDFFPDDFLGGVMHMHPHSVGMYVRMLCYQWSNGSIPESTRQLCQITGATEEELKQHLPEVMEKFELGPDGKRRNARLEAERSKKLGKSEKASESARLRWGRYSTDSGESREAGEYATAMRTHMPSHAPSICSSDATYKEVGSRKKEEGRGYSEEGVQGEEPGSTADWVVPDRLDSPRIRELLADFEAMRAKIKKPIRDKRATSRLLGRFEDEDHLAYALETCIANEYQGLKPDYRPPVKSASKATPSGTAPMTFGEKKRANSKAAFDEVFGSEETSNA